MVVRISIGGTIKGALSYNERKVAKSDADLILASGFSCDIADLGFTEKLRRFQLLIDRKKWIKKNTLHISLNFSPDEKLSTETMQAITLDYMKRMGFGDQPYLVYRHKDAKHPHVHIVTTNIKADGSFIGLHYIGKRLSEPARKAIEIEFGLIQAESRKKQIPKIMSAIELLPAIYGKEETKHIITNLVGDVLSSYKFTSLQELNLILRQMNIVADRGAPNSRMYQAGGLVFSLLNENGFRVGQAIKASEIYGKPTLKELTKKFSGNAVKKIAVKEFTQKSVNSALSFSRTASSFYDNLTKRRVSLVLQEDNLGIIKAVHFIDHRNRAVFSHEELGITLNTIYGLRAAEYLKKPASTKNNLSAKGIASSSKSSANPQPAFQLIHSLLQSGQSMGGPDEFPKKRKKKKKRPPL